MKPAKVNAAYEAIDRHAESDRRDKIALYYSDANREEQYTFLEMKEKSNRFGNVLRKLGIKKGDRVFIFMPRTPELYFSFLGAIKIGAVVGPLFEAFMEAAVRDPVGKQRSGGAGHHAGAPGSGAGEGAACAEACHSGG